MKKEVVQDGPNCDYGCQLADVGPGRSKRRLEDPCTYEKSKCQRK
jgi:hypothetical protein